MITQEEYDAKLKELDSSEDAEEAELFGPGVGLKGPFSKDIYHSLGASTDRQVMEKMSEILSSFLHALPKSHPGRGKYAAAGSSDNAGNFGPGERKEDLIKQKGPGMEFSDTMGQSGRTRKGISGIQDTGVHKALSKSLDGIYKRMLKKPFAETRPEHLVPVDSLTRTGEDITKVLHGLRETTALRKGYDNDFDSLASQYHAIKSHAKSVEDEGPGAKPLNKFQTELAKRIEGSWKKAGERLKVTAGELARRTTAAKSSNELDYLRKSHASTMKNLEKHAELSSKGADYQGDASHQIAQELHENTLKLERFLDKDIALKGRKGTGYKGGDTVTPREALAQLMERQKQLDDIRKKISRRKEDVQKSIDGLDAQIEGWTHDLNYAKKHGGVGIDNVTQQRWAKAFLSMLMHNFMWIWDRNMEAFERQFNARASEYYKFLDDHKDILGTFNNGRVSKAITFVSDLLRDPERLPTKYRTANKTAEMKRLLDLRRKLFLYKYSLANIGVLTTGFEDYADEKGIVVKDGIAELTKYDTELKHKETATENELAQAVDAFQRSNPELVAALEQLGVAKQASINAQFTDMGLRTVSMKAIQRIAKAFSKGA